MSSSSSSRAAPKDRERDRGAVPSKKTRAYVFLTNGDVTSIQCDAPMTKVLDAALPHLKRTSKVGRTPGWEFEPFPRRKGGYWHLCMDEEGMFTQPQNVGFPSFMFDMRRAFGGAIITRHAAQPGTVSNELDDMNWDTAAHLDDLPPKPTKPAGVADDDWDPEDAENCVYEEFFQELRDDWRRYRSKISSH